MPCPSLQISRRDYLKNLVSVAIALGITHALPAIHHAAKRGKRLGVVIHSYSIRNSKRNTVQQYPRFIDAIDFLNHIHALGAGGIQTSISGWSKTLASRLRNRCEALNLFLEGSISAPKSKEELHRFEQEIVIAKEAGVSVFRMAMGGRRYEIFTNRKQWLDFRKRSIERLQLAAPIAKKHRVQLAIENHKDWQTEDLVQILTQLGSEYLGVTLDTGNSIALLEHPDETARVLSNYAMSTHIKDMAVQEYGDGFLLSEVPLGTGILKLEAILNRLERKNPKINFNLEMITRDPLRVPCYTRNYWATFPDANNDRLYQMMRWTRANVVKEMLSLDNRSYAEKIEIEEQNNKLSIEYAEKSLGLAG